MGGLQKTGVQLGPFVGSTGLRPSPPKQPRERPPCHQRQPRETGHSGAGCPRMAMATVASRGRKVPGERNAAKGDRSRGGIRDTGRGRSSRKGLRPKKILDLRCTAGIDRATLLNRKSREGIERMQDRCVMLRAVNPERNVNRSWVCRIERDLFGACVASVTFGRAGTHGRTIRRMVSDGAAADRFLASALVRRRGSTKRCGAVYHVIETFGFDSKTQTPRMSCAKDRYPKGRDPLGLGERSE